MSTRRVKLESKPVAPSEPPIEVLDELPELVDIDQAPVEEPKPESSSLLTTSDEGLLAEYRRRAEEAEAALAEVKTKLQEVTGSQKPAEMPWADAQNRIVYWHPANCYSTFNPIVDGVFNQEKGKGLEFSPLFGGGSEYRTACPGEIAWLDKGSDPNNPNKKPGLVRLTPRPKVEV